MNTFIESIRVEQRQLQNLEFHERRYASTMAYFFPHRPLIPLREQIQIPDSLTEGLYKCRFVYGEQKKELSFQPYIPKPVQSLKVLQVQEIEYTYKYEDREILNQLYAQRGQSDDILIVKNELITDSSYSNLIFFDGSQWFTPASPLLQGVRREKLLQEGKIKAEEIKLKDLSVFRKVMLINAMLDFEEERAFSTSQIRV